MVDHDEKPVSAIKVFPTHGKQSKLAIGDQSVFYDNVLLEFNVRPSRTLLEFQSNFQSLLNGVNKILTKKGYLLTTKSSVKFPLDQCEDDEACVFGCEPEFCIYNRTEDNKIMRVEPPTLLAGNTFRSCGGHIHIGHVVANWETGGDPAKVVKLMDGFVGAIALLVDKDVSSLERKKLYGGAGTHRITSYGLEYRTLSNFWLSDPRLVELMYKLTRLAIEKSLTDPNVVDAIIDGPSLQAMINSGDVKQASDYYEKIKKNLSYELLGLVELCRSMGHNLHPQLSWYNLTLPKVA